MGPPPDRLQGAHGAAGATAEVVVQLAVHGVQTVVGGHVLGDGREGALLAAAGILETARAEEVPVAGFVTLANLWDAGRGR